MLTHIVRYVAVLDLIEYLVAASLLEDALWELPVGLSTPIFLALSHQKVKLLSYIGRQGLVR